MAVDDFIDEWFKCIADSLDYWKGKDKRLVLDDKLFDDPHTHFLKPKNAFELEIILEAIVRSLDTCSITDYGDSVSMVLSYNDLKNCAEDIALNNFKLKEDNGIIKTSYTGHDEKLHGKTSVVYRSQEIRTNTHLHITAEGSAKTHENDLNPVRTCEEIRQHGGNVLIEHPCTKQWKFMYVLTNEEEDLYTLEIMKYADAIEVFNSMNTFFPLLFFHSSGYMFVSNIRAKNLYERFHRRGLNIGKFGGTDNHWGSGISGNPYKRHFYLKRLGKAGTYFPKLDFEKMDGKEFFEWRRQCYEQQRTFPFENYTDPITFYKEMIPPKLWKILGKKSVDSIS